jgi:GcrA cell cycle regulator
MQEAEENRARTRAARRTPANDFIAAHISGPRATHWQPETSWAQILGRTAFVSDAKRLTQSASNIRTRNVRAFRVCWLMSTFRNPPSIPPRDDLDIPLNERKSIETLLPSDCRWPIGDPLNGDFHFCGKGRDEGDPYCEFHMRRAFQSSRPRMPRYVPRAIG